MRPCGLEPAPLARVGWSLTTGPACVWCLDLARVAFGVDLNVVPKLKKIQFLNLSTTAEGTGGVHAIARNGDDRAERGEPRGRGSPRGTERDGDGLEGDTGTTARRRRRPRGAAEVGDVLGSARGFWCSSGLGSFGEDDDGSTLVPFP